MTMPQTPLQHASRTKAGSRTVPSHVAPPPVYPRSGYARKHPRLQDAPLRRPAGAEDEPADFGNAV